MTLSGREVSVIFLPKRINVMFVERTTDKRDKAAHLLHLEISLRTIEIELVKMSGLVIDSSTVTFSLREKCFLRRLSFST